MSVFCSEKNAAYKQCTTKQVGASDSVIREARRPHAEIAKTSCDKGLKHAKKSKKTGEGGVSKGSSVAVARSRSKRAKKAPSTATAKKANTRALGRTREEVIKLCDVHATAGSG